MFVQMHRSAYCWLKMENSAIYVTQLFVQVDVQYTSKAKIIILKKMHTARIFGAILFEKISKDVDFDLF